ncbi:MAG: hypothetical protein CML04_00860 [Pseudozobellia sp.]|nr:hypothetical protein [Pseudozobellia sp.]MBG48107.1 hypothetical protein [Pseudozobellia sp.]|tara:strand:- start:3518 stop:4117 length:600 start_codon:yes stop_codon:yes gene_type:complete
MNPKPTLLCIPDISGFTEFMSKVDFDLGSKVIPSLLNNIIYSNNIGLKISEIEGDAVLFYKQGKLPSFGDLINQCKKFYTDFYFHIDELIKKEDSARAKDIPKILGLKIILHFGEEIAHVKVGKHIKLIGEDVITAHKLLKNDIAKNEYILLSEKLLAQFNENFNEVITWEKLQSDVVYDEHVGEIQLQYIDLSPLKPV